MRILNFYHIKDSDTIRKIIYFQKNTVGIEEEGLKYGQRGYSCYCYYQNYYYYTSIKAEK